MDLEDIKSSEVTQIQKKRHFPSYVNFSHICVNIYKQMYSIIFLKDTKKGQYLAMRKGTRQSK